MAAVTLEGPTGKKRVYRVRWRYKGQRPQKSLGSISSAEARRRRDEIEETLRLLETGRLVVPDGLDETEFIFSAGLIPDLIEEVQLCRDPTANFIDHAVAGEVFACLQD